MNNRDLDLLSAYLDKQLNPNESARLEARIASDIELASTLADLRAARGILRKLPKRIAPRNFALTRKMVGLNPPLPRSYSFFQFATAFASVLLVLTFAANILAPRLNYVGQINGGSGGGGDGYGGGPIMPQSAPAAAEVPATEAPAATAAPALEMTAPLVTATASMDTTTVEAPMAGKQSGAGKSAPQDQPQVKHVALIPIEWQISLLVVGLISLTVMLALRQSAKRKWQ